MLPQAQVLQCGELGHIHQGRKLIPVWQILTTLEQFPSMGCMGTSPLWIYSRNGTTILVCQVDVAYYYGFRKTVLPCVQIANGIPNQSEDKLTA
jgi:hypothetical protein